MSKASEIDRQAIADREYLRAWMVASAEDRRAWAEAGVENPTVTVGAWELLTRDEQAALREIGIKGPEGAHGGHCSLDQRRDDDRDQTDTFALHVWRIAKPFDPQVDKFIEALAPHVPRESLDKARELFIEHAVVPTVEDIIREASHAILKALYILTNSKHWMLRKVTWCLLAAIGILDKDSQAEKAREFGETRQAFNKRVNNLRDHPSLLGLETFIFGGHPERREAAKERALRVHEEIKTLCKTTPTNSVLHQLQNWRNAA